MSTGDVCVLCLVVYYYRVQYADAILLLLQAPTICTTGTGRLPGEPTALYMIPGKMYSSRTYSAEPVEESEKYFPSRYVMRTRLRPTESEHARTNSNQAL